MSTADNPLSGHFALVTAAQQLVLRALPFRSPGTAEALATFMATVDALAPRAAELHAVLLETLTVLNPHTGGRFPTLAERYLALGRGAGGALFRFRQTLEELPPYGGVRSDVVRAMLQAIDDEHSDPTLTLTSVSATLHRNADALGSRLRKETGLTFDQYRREVRLHRAAGLLAVSGKPVKEVRFEVGYKDDSTFTHDFKAHFGVCPREYRARTLPSTPPRPIQMTPPRHHRLHGSETRASVLIVDDDECTRDLLARYLGLDGHPVDVAPTGAEGFMVAARGAPRVVLLDYHLPDMDGVTWLRELRRRRGVPQPAVAIITADWNIWEHITELGTLRATVVTKPLYADGAADLVQSLGAAQP